MTDKTAFSLSLNGSNSYGQTNNVPNYSFGSAPFTVEAWVLPTAAGAVVAQMGSDERQGSGWGLFVEADGRLKFTTFDQTSIPQVFVTAESQDPLPLFDGSWHHVAAVRQDQTIVLYFDGVPVPVNINLNTATPVHLSANLALTVGATSLIGSQTNRNLLSGLLDEVRLWNVGLEQWQLDQGIYHIMDAKKPNLVGQYSFDDKTGNDSSSLGNNLAFQGQPLFDLPGFYFVPEGQPFFAIQSRLTQDYAWTASGGGKEVTSYAVSISPRNSDGSKMASTIKVWADQPATIVSQGVSYSIDSTTPAAIPTNPLQQVNLFMATGDSLLAPVLFIGADFMGVDERVVVPVDRQAHHELSMVQGADMIAGKSPLLDPKTITAEQADAIARTVRNVMSTAVQHDMQPKYEVVQGQSSAPKKRHLSTRRVIRGRLAQSGIGFTPERESYLPVAMPCPCCDPKSDLIKCHYMEEAAEVERLTVSAFMPDPHWQFNVTNRTFQSLPKVTALKTLALARSARLTASEADALSSESLWDQFVNGVLDVVDIVVSIGESIYDGVSTVITYVVNGVTKFFDFVVATVEDAVGFIKGLFHQLGVLIDKVIDFLKALFNWEDILITHRVANRYVQQMGQYAVDAMTDLKGQVNRFFTSIEGKVTAAFDQAIAGLGDHSVGSGGQSATLSPPPSIQSDYVSQKVSENGWDSPLQSAAPGPGETGLNTMVTAWQTNNGADMTTLATQSGSATSQVLDDVGDLMTEALKILLDALKQGVVIALKIIDALIEGLLSLIADAIAYVMDLLTTRINIPFVTWLYEEVITGDGSKLTAIDLLSLLSALPTTVLYKLFNDGKAPFTKAFADQFDTMTYQQWGFMHMPSEWWGAPKQTQFACMTGFEATNGDDPPEWVAILSYVQSFLFMGGVFVWYPSAAAVDGASAVNSPTAQLNSKWLVAGETVAQFASFPIHTKVGANSAAAWELGIWGSQFLPLAMDSLTALISNKNWTGRWVDLYTGALGNGVLFGYGLLHAAGFSYLAYRESEEKGFDGTILAKVVGNVCTTLPEIGHVFMLMQDPRAKAITPIIDLFSLVPVIPITLGRTVDSIAHHTVAYPR